MRKIFLTVCALFFCLLIVSCSGKVRFRVIIDTDWAADDLRTICMLLSNSEVETLAISTSEGALKPADVALKVSALLHHLQREEIPVGVGRALNIEPPVWRKQSEQIVWGNAANIVVPEQTAKDLITQTIENEEEKITLICLGTLTNLNDVLTANPELKTKIERVIWYNSSASPLRGANYEADPASADNVLASGIRIDIISGENNQEIAIDRQYIDMIAHVDNIYAKKITETHNSGVLKPVVEFRHMRMWVDLVAIYLFAPELFTSTGINKTVSLYSPANADAAEQAKNISIKILTGKRL